MSPRFLAAARRRDLLARYAMQVLFIQMSALGVILALCIIIDNSF